MQDSATVAAADIARLAGVGRAAVSNWRRRFADFPAPVGGTSSSPLFSLAEVEEWLRRQGKLAEVPLDERVWQQLRAGVEDLQLAQVVGSIGTFLLFGEAEELPVTFSRSLLDAVSELAAERGAASTFDFLYDRYLEAHSRRVVTLPPEVADLMTALVVPDGGTVLDPTCGLGGLLVSAATAGASRVHGQDRDEDAARIATARLLLRGHDAVIRTGDSLRADGFAEVLADAVICAPPFGERHWGYEELASDVRWQYGLPPRGESELAWVQHCLSHLKPGGHAAVLMPAAAAGRRSGRRIRAQLLRSGALRAVASLPVGAAPHALGVPHLWILRKPAPGDSVPSHVLLFDASDVPWTQLGTTVLDRWQAFASETGDQGARALIELLDEEVDLTPLKPAAGAEETFSSSYRGLVATVAELQQALRDVQGLSDTHSELPKTTIAEQVRAGSIVAYQAPRQQADSGKLPVLTVDDVLAGLDPSGRTSLSADMVRLEPGDVVVPMGGRAFVARIVQEEDAVLGSGLLLLRVDPSRIDTACLAGFLRIAGTQASGRSQSGTSRSDLRKVEIPRLSLEEQRRLGVAFTRLERLKEIVGRVAQQGTALVDLAITGLGSGKIDYPYDRGIRKQRSQAADSGQWPQKGQT
ncbi:N-6 DNA methylase [Nonomuraea bangladeshensis]|uniref:N-6 DNA methylase n=1 Tax=Nonomuraea bangladeshensis TaxID=404385 RepID=UPI003C2D10AD